MRSFGTVVQRTGVPASRLTIVHIVVVKVVNKHNSIGVYHLVAQVLCKIHLTWRALVTQRTDWISKSCDSAGQ